ncbi:uncharacterized protein PITG_14905 [Phytophthora infestans T30-4]|uniref:Uncharacterized protein n=2 Tax=Phytophthora infestans (strain T30-4) TaxID=403677 RepID=D0NPA2_PHYIT|nr:uncharacterized protein PITG_14905 [Phytophthora infestans T30-4]EEY62444.1 conserved hypothetical protein [Phytophthora infestans T30-4]|eukprot:XP_002899080.1 conserved hypothetical protein [Phytophthora infestans T30-4]
MNDPPTVALPGFRVRCAIHDEEGEFLGHGPWLYAYAGINRSSRRARRRLVKAATLCGAFALALLSVSNAQHATQQQQQTPHQSSKGAEPDSSMLLAALNDVDSYKSSTLICLYKVNMLDVKKDTYNYSVTGCKVDPEFVGRCPDLTSFPGCGSYNVVLTSKSKKPKVMSIKKASK